MWLDYVFVERGVVEVGGLANALKRFQSRRKELDTDWGGALVYLLILLEQRCKFHRVNTPQSEIY